MTAAASRGRSRKLERKSARASRGAHIVMVACRRALGCRRASTTTCLAACVVRVVRLKMKPSFFHGQRGHLSSRTQALTRPRWTRTDDSESIEHGWGSERPPPQFLRGPRSLPFLSSPCVARRSADTPGGDLRGQMREIRASFIRRWRTLSLMSEACEMAVHVNQHIQQ